MHTFPPNMITECCNSSLPLELSGSHHIVRSTDTIESLCSSISKSSSSTIALTMTYLALVIVLVYFYL